MKRAKRTPATSVEAAVKAMVDAAKPAIEPPAHVRLRDGDRPFWDGVIRARARDEWTDADLVVAGQLARCQHDMEAQQELLDAESPIVTNERGTQIANPRFAVLQQLAQREMALMRTLRMGGRVAGDARDEQGRRKLQRQAEAARQQVGQEGEAPLLAI